MLTPPAPGNQRAGLWSDKTLDFTEWSADLEFRASGQEHASGKLQLWLVKDGQHDVGESGLYTVDKFQGLVIVVDDYGSTVISSFLGIIADIADITQGGNIRGFLNDGTTSYKNHHHVDSLTFGHCEYPFRNLGRPSQLRIHQDANNFKVTIDGQSCFESPQIRIPPGYNFGITAASAPDPDSFEIFKFVTLTHNTDFNSKSRQDAGQMHNHVPPPQFQRQPDTVDPKEVNAESIAKDKEFADLHDRLQAHNRHLAQMQLEMNQGLAKQDGSQAEIKMLLVQLANRLEALERKVTSIDEATSQHDHGKMHQELKDHVQRQGDTFKMGLDYDVMSAIHEGHSRLYNFLKWMVIIQAVGVVAYFGWKSRKNSRKANKYM